MTRRYGKASSKRSTSKSARKPNGPTHGNIGDGPARIKSRNIPRPGNPAGELRKRCSQGRNRGILEVYMNFTPLLDAVGAVANVASILTAVIAAIASIWYFLSGRRRMKKLEAYLRTEKNKTAGREDRGQRSLLHVMARVGLTEQEALQASFKSPYIKRLLATGQAHHLATDILFEYDPTGTSN